MTRETTSPRRLPQTIHERGITALRKPDGEALIKGKLYLRLLHGRNAADEDLDSWGFEGPTFGPLDNFHITYLTTFSFSSDVEEAELMTAEDLFVFDGKYYGDLSLFIA